MPKAPKKKTNQAAKAAAPTSRPKAKDPKASHLYTDDNPATTIHGTGFKDRAAAEHTLELISKRSLIYQFQTVNTLFHRAKGHPHKGQGIEEAMEVFREWLDVTYPEAKNALRAGGWKPLLSKRCVERYLPRLKESKIKGMPEALAFAERYIALEPRKKLGNILVDDSLPEEADLERKRYDRLCDLVPESKETLDGWEDVELWGKDRKVTDEHARLIAWAWSPTGERKLP